MKIYRILVKNKYQNAFKIIPLLNFNHFHLKNYQLSSVGTTFHTKNESAY